VTWLDVFLTTLWGLPHGQLHVFFKQELDMQTIQLPDGSTVQMRLTKDKDGWRAMTTVDLKDHRVLTITTRKQRFGTKLQTIAQVWTEKDGLISYVIGNGLQGDFRQTYFSQEVNRVTEKNVRLQHESFFEAEGVLPKVLAHVEQFYAAKAAQAAQYSPTASATPAMGCVAN